MATAGRIECCARCKIACQWEPCSITGTSTNYGRPCGYSKLCPWCHARNVERIYRRLVAGPCSAARLEGKSLVLVRLGGYDTTCGGGSVLDRTEVQCLRESGKQSAKSIVNDLGIEGGIIFHQFGPKRVYGPRCKVVDEAFSEEVVMVGESKSITPEKLAEYEDSGYDMLLLPADTPHALRYFLFGTSYKFPVESIEGLDIISRCSDKDRIPLFTKYGIPGRASLQPWFLFNETQAWSYLDVTAGTRLCDTFGTWRKNGRTAAKTETEKGRRISPEQALHHANKERKNEARDRRAGLMPKAERVFQRLRSELGLQSRQHCPSNGAGGGWVCGKRPRQPLLGEADAVVLSGRAQAVGDVRSPGSNYQELDHQAGACNHTSQPLRHGRLSQRFKSGKFVHCMLGPSHSTLLPTPARIARCPRSKNSVMAAPYSKSAAVDFPSLQHWMKCAKCVPRIRGMLRWGGGKARCASSGTIRGPLP